jgi:uncharacterized membrane protein YobD (UPF0266 family)
MSFWNGNSLLAEYNLAKRRRTQGMLFGFFAGILIGAFITNDPGWSTLGGLLLTCMFGAWKSIDVVRIERIIYPGGKK